MTPRHTSLALTALSVLLFAIAAQAGEVSMDVRGLSADSEQTSSSSTPTTYDASSPTPAEIRSPETATVTRNRWRASASSQQALVDDRSEAAGSSSSSGGSSSNVIAAPPVKPRNRWQSLVPGAIK